MRSPPPTRLFAAACSSRALASAACSAYRWHSWPTPSPTAPALPALGMLQAISALGNIAAASIGLGVGVLAARGLVPFNLKSWQALFLVGALPAFACALAILRLPEPPKWILARADGARRGIKFGSYRRLLGHPRWSRHAWLGLALCCSGIIGLWGIGNFHPKIVRSIVDLHFAGAHRRPRFSQSKRVHWTSLALLFQISEDSRACWRWRSSPRSKGAGRPSPSRCCFRFCLRNWSSAICAISARSYWMLPIMGFGQLSVFGVYAIYLPELFPTSLRSTGTGFLLQLRAPGRGPGAFHDRPNYREPGR